MAIIVKNMLDAKGRDVVTVGPDKTLLEVAGILNDKKIGAVVVTGMEGRIAGIFTERDLVRAVAGKGAAVLDQPVKSAMTTSVQRCKDETTVDELMGMMSSGRFRHVPVEQDGKLAGIISIGDVVKSRIREIELEAEHIKAYIAG
ncbi:Putative signal-transduction protein containing cAMP-binding and CBS domains [Neorhizobium galegae bv. officinalis]|jgi:CBS domain-containing protein|uniref:Putative signal-transduction protein containing cAMP-binding and CBS domains n=1 Tax=Neorhizobium galegae bv. officinalis TaxID=323656 RepID=A0A0T7GRP9_NEOGA|nr:MULTISPECIES: CBS domain-containing protein [Neorhizobium]CDZ35275.1 Putative signal-transduction protein containing cAMP-binding and CBS domains [Neorhizobium galegae bv. officinalis]CDZ49964.1 Putative signal-transduction protein containing cAMP-binding and CBS domains [Neorhizobium galegae bv. officinalis]